MDPGDDMDVEVKGADADDLEPSDVLSLDSFAHTRLPHQHLDKKVRDLVRFAIFTEHKRVRTSRSINEDGMLYLLHTFHLTRKTFLVLGSGIRSFNAMSFKA